MPHWTSEAKRDALEWFARRHEQTVWENVLVAAPGWRGWPEDAQEHRLDGLAVDGPPEVRTFIAHEVAEAMQQAATASPVLAWSYADRPALGALAARTAMLWRSFPGGAALRPVALVARGADRPNTKPAFNARGVVLVAVPEERHR